MNKISLDLHLSISLALDRIFQFKTLNTSYVEKCCSDTVRCRGVHGNIMKAGLKLFITGTVRAKIQNTRPKITYLLYLNTSAGVTLFKCNSQA